MILAPPEAALGDSGTTSDESPLTSGHPPTTSDESEIISDTSPAASDTPEMTSEDSPAASGCSQVTSEAPEIKRETSETIEEDTFSSQNIKKSWF